MFVSFFRFLGLILGGTISAIGPSFPSEKVNSLSANELQNLLAVGREGTTIIFQGGADKVYYAPQLKNALRRTPQLGLDFLKKNLRPLTISEGAFIAATLIDGKLQTISGVGGIEADKQTGNGIIYLVQTFPGDTTLENFLRRDRLYAVFTVIESETGLVCRWSKWEKLFSFKGQREFMFRVCDFLVGNSVRPTL